MSGELSSFFNINKVFILGAGFSRPAGLPLATELLPLLHHKASSPILLEPSNKKKFKYTSNYLLDELRYYYPLSQITHTNISRGKCDINIEEFLSFMASESAFLHPGDRLTEHGSKFISFAKQWLGEIIYEIQVDKFKSLPSFYSDFTSRLSSSLVLTFNWDTLLEHLFEIQNIKYRHQLNVSTYSKRMASIPLLKLHGSIDWVSKNKHPYFHEDWMRFIKLDIGFKDKIKIIGDLPRYYNKMYYPWIILPNFDKLNQLNKFGELWQYPWRYLDDTLEIIIIGYSFRKDDFHTRAFIYPKLVQGSKNGNLKVKVIDFAKNDIEKFEIKDKYKGINNCKFWFDGFNKESIDFIFD